MVQGFLRLALISFSHATPRLRQLITSPSLQVSRFSPKTIHVGFVVDKVALGEVILQVLGSALVISVHQCSQQLH